MDTRTKEYLELQANRDMRETADLLARIPGGAGSSFYEELKERLIRFAEEYAEEIVVIRS